MGLRAIHEVLEVAIHDAIERPGLRLVPREPTQAGAHLFAEPRELRVRSTGVLEGTELVVVEVAVDFQGDPLAEHLVARIGHGSSSR